MAYNPNSPSGFALYTPGARMRWYDKASCTYRIGIGDPVTLESTGYVDRHASGADKILGVAMGFLNADGIPVVYLATTSLGKVLVCDDPKALFVIQASGYISGTTSLAQTNIGNCADTSDDNCVVATGQSIYTLDATDLASSPEAVAELKIVGVYDVPFNKFITGADGRYVRVIVKLNEHFYRTTAGI